MKKQIPAHLNPLNSIIGKAIIAIVAKSPTPATEALKQLRTATQAVLMHSYKCGATAEWWNSKEGQKEQTAIHKMRNLSDSFRLSIPRDYDDDVKEETAPRKPRKPIPLEGKHTFTEIQKYNDKIAYYESSLNIYNRYMKYKDKASAKHTEDQE